MRYGGCNPAIHVQADVRRTRLIGTTQVYEGGVMMVRARDPIYKMSHLKGKKIGLSKSLNVIKNDCVARPGGARHRADAHAERHDPRRRGDRGVPLSR